VDESLSTKYSLDVRLIRRPLITSRFDGAIYFWRPINACAARRASEIITLQIFHQHNQCAAATAGAAERASPPGVNYCVALDNVRRLGAINFWARASLSLQCRRRTHIRARARAAAGEILRTRISLYLRKGKLTCGVNNRPRNLQNERDACMWSQITSQGRTGIPFMHFSKSFSTFLNKV
jgi:hypothetical protein